MAPKGEQRYTILVADDSEMNRSILRSMLEESYDIIEAENGEQAGTEKSYPYIVIKTEYLEHTVLFE